MNKELSEIFPEPPEGVAVDDLDPARIPQHVAVIMDGNGRWAKKRTMNRLRGHSAGIEAVRETIRCASDLGVRYLTIYSFSTENWKRPEEEVDGLMDLFAKTMLAEVDGLHEENVRVMTIGDTSGLPVDTREAFEEAWDKTRDNTGMTLVVAVNYGARAEIVRALGECLREAAGSLGTDGLGGERASAAGLADEEAATCAAERADALTAVADALSEEAVAAHLYTAGMPDPELVIRTSGEMRLSNFLLWQAAYSEFVSTDVLWPDFDRYELLRCLLDYQSRERRFGGV